MAKDRGPRDTATDVVRGGRGRVVHAVIWLGRPTLLTPTSGARTRLALGRRIGVSNIAGTGLLTPENLIAATPKRWTRGRSHSSTSASLVRGSEAFGGRRSHVVDGILAIPPARYSHGVPLHVGYRDPALLSTSFRSRALRVAP